MTDWIVQKEIQTERKEMNARLDQLIILQRTTNVLLTKLLEMKNDPHPEEAARWD
jgi:hypothetical protein